MNPVEKYKCSGFNCAVYIFGHSTDGVCPGCGEPGVVLSNNQALHLLDIFHFRVSTGV